MQNFELNDVLYNHDEKLLMGAFLSEVTDIIIYIEDTADGMRNFYKKLLEKKFPNITIDNIIPLGKKTEVIKACQERPYPNLKELYIIDGDLDIILNKKVKNRSLFQHNVYCIENYLFDEEAISNFISDESGKIDDIQSIKKALNVDYFFNEIFSYFIEIYKLFAIVYKNKLDIPTISSFDDSIYLYRKGNYTTIRIEVLYEKFNILKNQIVDKIGIKKFQSDLDEINTYILSIKVEDYRKIISGKNELLYLLKGYAQHIARKLDQDCKNIMQINHSSLKVKLAKYTNHHHLNELFYAIEQTINHGFYEEAS